MITLLEKVESHAEYLANIITSRYATVGKFADSSANLSSTILLSPDEEPKRIRERTIEYAGNLAFLLPHLPEPSDD